ELGLASSRRPPCPPPGALMPPPLAVPKPGRHAVAWNVTLPLGRKPVSVGPLPNPMPLARSRLGLGSPKTQLLTPATPSAPVTTHEAFTSDPQAAPVKVTLPLAPVIA